MHLLSIETTDQAGTVAALDGRNVLLEMALSPDQRSAQSLAPAVATLLGQVGWKPRELEVVSVVIGPGSFTGLRVGLTTARLLAYAAGAELLGVGAFEAIVERVPAEVDCVAVAIDAQRGDVVARNFRRGADGLATPEGPERLLSFSEWLSSLPEEAWLTGPALLRYHSRIPPERMVLPRDLWAPTASAAGVVAAGDYKAGRRDNLFALVPRYSRRSGAEEKWEQKHGGQ